MKTNCSAITLIPINLMCYPENDKHHDTQNFEEVNNKSINMQMLHGRGIVQSFHFTFNGQFSILYEFHYYAAFWFVTSMQSLVFCRKELTLKAKGLLYNIQRMFMS